MNLNERDRTMGQRSSVLGSQLEATAQNENKYKNQIKS